jgi:polyhydroxyalkanoate synthase subunit PhaC
MAGSAPTATNSDSVMPASDAIWTSSERALEMMRAVLTSKNAPLGQTPKEVVWRKNKSRLYHYLRETPATHRTPVFLSMPLINRADILDLRPGGSFIEYLVSQGFEVFMYDWGIWGPEDRNVTVTELLTNYLPRAVRHACDFAGHEMTMLGYCIGGTLAACFAALYPEAPIKNLVLFTAPIDFAQSGDFGVWTAKGVFPIDKIREVLPTVPPEMIDTGSKMLNPLGNMVGTYVKLWEKLGDPKFDVKAWQAMNRWVNDGTPFPGAAYYQWITEFYQENKLVKGTFEVVGKYVHMPSIQLPLLNVAASADVIAPRATTAAIMNCVSSVDKEEILLEGGHVGIVVGRMAKGNLWPRVSEWLTRHD